MPTELPRGVQEVHYFQAEQEYLRKLPPEHFMEPTSQATQREITLESLALVRAERPEVQVFNELLVQYPVPGKKRLGQVVPDNMVVVHDRPIEAEGSYNVPLQPVGPLWVLEYVTKSSRRKDYDDNMRKYERDLKVPYYLLFVPDQQEMTLYRHEGERYMAVPPDAERRCLLPELDLAMGLLAGWVRFWYQGKLLPLPGELQHALKHAVEARDRARQDIGSGTRSSPRSRARIGGTSRTDPGVAPANGRELTFHPSCVVTGPPFAFPSSLSSAISDLPAPDCRMSWKLDCARQRRLVR